MVDIIKPISPVSTLLSSTNVQRQNRLTSKHLSLPVLVTTVDNIPSNEQTNIFLNSKRWIGRCPGEMTNRQLTTSNVAYNIHRKMIYRELSQFYPMTTGDLSAMIKIKQQHQQKNFNKESLKVTIGTATTVTSLPTVSSVDAQSSRLFDTLSKHVTIKAEPLRPTNYFINNTNKFVSSWKKYWASTHIQRRRKEPHDIEFPYIRDQQPSIPPAHFLTVHDSSLQHINNENNSFSRKSSIISNCSTITECPSPIIFDNQSSFIKEENHVSLSRTVSLSIIDLSKEKHSPMNNSLKLIDQKHLSPIQSKCSIINNNDDNKIPNETNLITARLYKLPLPSAKPRVSRISIKHGSQTKSSEKKLAKNSSSDKKETTTTTSSVTTTSTSKTKQQTSSNKSNRITIKKQHSLSTVITTIPRSKYEQINWEEPYIGIRFDPPTPPCSPSLFIWPEDSDQDEDDRILKQNFIIEI
ncbi:unnamed protein product [Adineta steineri]|uniref:Uncharacterized protein n=1 Tax=Adineta steineri TaxID=433720 RepID=A0A814SDV0_9BILA|nr:unnamed protein product [Adineta steineri]CAF4004010.1 unnamed protein product [Adineta steineri]